MLAFALASQELLEIHYWAVFQSNIVQLTTSVHPEQSVALAFAQRFVVQIASVSPINFVCKESASPPATAIQPAPISNSAKTISAHKKFDAELTTTVCSTNTAKSTHMADLNAEMHAKAAFSAVEMLNAQPEITMLYALANLASSTMAKADADELSARATANVHRINSVKRTSVNWLARVAARVARKRFVQLKTTGQFVTVNRATAEIRTNNVTQWITVATPRAAQELSVRTTKEHSTVRAAMDTLEIHITKVVA